MSVEESFLSGSDEQRCERHTVYINYVYFLEFVKCQKRGLSFQTAVGTENVNENSLMMFHHEFLCMNLLCAAFCEIFVLFWMLEMFFHEISQYFMYFMLGTQLHSIQLLFLSLSKQSIFSEVLCWSQ